MDAGLTVIGGTVFTVMTVFSLQMGVTSYRLTKNGGVGEKIAPLHALLAMELLVLGVAGAKFFISPSRFTAVATILSVVVIALAATPAWFKARNAVQEAVERGELRGEEAKKTKEAVDISFIAVWGTYLAVAVPLFIASLAAP